MPPWDCETEAFDWLKSDHPTIGRKGREWIESGGADMPPDLLMISACGAPCAQTEIEDELIDVGEHATG